MKRYCSITLRFVVYLVAACSLCAPSLGAYPNVRHYSDIVIRRGELDVRTAPWAAYDATVRVEGVRSNVSDHDDSIVFQPLDFCMPFFSQDSAEIHIASNGFLSPMPVAMCPQFCSGSTEIEGFYKFGDSIREFDGKGGGDWPLIGIYVHDLNPASRQYPNGGIYAQKKTKTYFGQAIDVVVVEYYRVPQFLPESDGVLDAWLTAQAELWPNGTIILRYENVFSTVKSYQNLIPAVGLVWSPLQMRAVQRPVFSSLPAGQSGPAVDVVAVRFDPHDDVCIPISNCDVCIRTPGCDWCANVDRCISRMVSSDFCRNSDVRTANGTCDRATTADGQIFYTSRVEADQPFIDISTHPNMRLLVNDGRVMANGAVNITLDFAFPIFYNPQVLDPSNPRMRRNVFVFPQQFISVMSSTQNCVQSDGLCLAGDYSFTIAAFASSTSPMQITREYTLRLPARNRGDFMCNRDSCPASYVIQIESQSMRSSNGQLLSFQTVLNADGSVEFFYISAFNETLVTRQQSAMIRALGVPPPGLKGVSPSNCGPQSQESPFLAFPRGFVGILRNGVSDSASLVIPPTIPAAAPRVRIVITPVPGCPDCNGRGSCNPGTRVCQCVGNFAGASCEQCKPGSYGPFCVNCTTCFNKGTCDDGVSGSGACKCVEPFSGRFCEKQCPVAAPGRSQCPNCNIRGGYCDCGKCVCDKEKGWHGDNCDTWRDPCRQLSLDGCATCLAYKHLTCIYCVTFNCIADVGNFDIPVANATQCSAYYTAATANRCPVYKRPYGEDGSLTVIAIVVLFTAMGLCTCVTVLVVCIFRKRAPNPLISGAVVGSPDFEMPRREREVIQMQMVTRPTSGQPVQGIPLKQVPLKELYAFQQQRRAAMMGFVSGSSAVNRGPVPLSASARTPSAVEPAGFSTQTTPGASSTPQSPISAPAPTVQVSHVVVEGVA